MSMLAEPRRKQKWAVDPNNSAWSKDDSKFGQKMLERMGWTKGKGLGRSEQGSTDHIKVKVKNNNSGLGANISHEDNWISHQDEFNELLAQLNNHHSQTDDGDKDVLSDEKKSFSLEEKSKTSKKRVHYMKFTKGKDLSSRSETDLNCIFGKRMTSSKEKDQENIVNDSQSDSEENKTPASTELDKESTNKTVTSTLTMREYFAQRMAQLKMAREVPDAASAEPETSEVTEEPSPVHTSVNGAEETKREKKRKKPKKEVIEECSSTTVEMDNKDQECLRKKKKRKMRENNEDFGFAQDLESNQDEPPPSKKKNNKHKNCELPNGNETVESEVYKNQERHQEEEGSVKKKKSKKKRKTENLE